MAINRVLVANRGEIARRVFRTARSMGLSTVAIYADGDADAPFVTDADTAIALGGSTAAESYLDAAKVLEAARRTGADAIHPGYGFLSENATFARTVTDAGLTWIGPPPDAIAAMGDKLSAKRLMDQAGVPTLPSVEVTSDTDLDRAAADIGFPVLVKASAGGGGKGMRIVAEPGDLAEAVAGAQREAASSFGDGTVFLERYLPAPRHVEIQVLGDTHGNLVHLFERECSVQRRHQKVLEEAPSSAVTPALRERMGAAAVAAVSAIGYHSAGTVEFLLDGQGDDAPFYFLEVNTRLQVEHPVTEEITGLDLVREMIRIADGEALGYAQDDLTIDGHAVEARLYAEDPANDFLPAIGTLSVWDPADEGVRYDSGVERGSVVGVHFDPMLAKVVAHGPTRREASLRLARALERTRLGGVTTNRDFLVAALRSEMWLTGDTTTAFIERAGLAGQWVPSATDLAGAAAAVALASQHTHRAAARVLGFLPSGYRNSSMPDEELRLGQGADDLTLYYRRQRDGSFHMSIDDGPRFTVELHDIDGDFVDASVDGVRSTTSVCRIGDTWYTSTPNGSVTFVERPRFSDGDGDAVAGAQVAPMPGRIGVIRVQPGERVTAGQVLVIMEAMKMEHQITAPSPGTVAEVRVAEGQQVDNGAVLVVITPDED